MPHHNSVFHGILKQIPRAGFERLVRQFKGDYRVRRLSCWTQFVALLYAQLADVQSLRGLEAVLASHAPRLYHLGIEPIHRSSLADANASRDPALFEALFASLLPKPTAIAREAGTFLRLIDATVIDLNGRAGWAHYRDLRSALKAHVVFDPTASVPTYFTITPAKTNEVLEARKLAIEAGATYVFDGGYYSFAWWSELDAAGCRFVTRLKKNSPLTLIEERPLDPAGAAIILSDRVGTLNRRLKGTRHNPYQKPVREVTVRIDTGKILRLVTNDLTSPATEIAALYKTRWQIELFFKWIKQNLRIKAFYGTTLNAVRIQIAIAMIAYLLIRTANGATTQGMQTLMKLIRANLMHRKPVHILKHSPPIRETHNQTMQLSLL
jgi:hypothetical protein